MRTSALALLALTMVLTAGCASSEDGDGTENAGAAQSDSARNLLDQCPALDFDKSFMALSASVAPEKPFMIAQTLKPFDGGPASKSPVVPVANYNVQFSRSASGTKFVLSIAPFFGVGPIDGSDKFIQVSGKVVLNADGKTGTLDVDTRREVIERVMKRQVTGFTFSALSCADGRASMSLDIPVLSFENASETTERTQTQVGEFDLAPKMRWNVLRPNGALKLEPVFG